MGIKLWDKVQLPFLRPGYECHNETGRFRYGRNNPIEDDGPYVRFWTSNDEHQKLPKVWLYALMYSDKPESIERVDDPDRDVTAQPDADADVTARVEALTAASVPFEQCDRCGEPILHEVVALAAVPGYQWFRRDYDAELKHEVLCSEAVVNEWPLGKKRIPRPFGKTKTKETQ